jgi:hypothetical protein
MMDQASSNAPTAAVSAISDGPEDEIQTSAEAQSEPVITQESAAVVPAGPATSERGEKRSFWRRIAPARAGKRGPDASAAISAQVEALAGQLAGAEQALAGRIEAVEHQIDSVWEVEEQLSHLMEIQKKLDSLSKTQNTLGESLATTTRLVGVASGLIVVTAALVVAAAAGLLAF